MTRLLFPGHRLNMTKHWQSCHKGEEKPKFGVKIIRSFTSCLVRQLWEADRIGRRLQEQAKGSEFETPKLQIRIFKV